MPLLRALQDRRKTALGIVAGMLALGSCGFFAGEGDDAVIDLGGVQFRYDPSADALTGVVTHTRGAMRSTSLRMRLVPDDPQTEFSFGIVTANRKGDGATPSAEGPALYFGDCTYEDGPGDFRRVIGSDTCHTSPHRDAYHFRPGGPEIMIVRCHAGGFMQCALSLYDGVGRYEILVTVAILENRPEDWLSIAARVRRFIRDHITPVA